MSTVNVLFQIQAAIANAIPSNFPADGLVTPRTIALSTELRHEQRVSVSTSIVTIFDTTSDNASFKCAAIISDAAVSIQWGGASAADNSTIDLPANVPFFLPLNTMRAYAAAGDLSGGSTTITSIKAKTAAGTAKVDICVFG